MDAVSSETRPADVVPVLDCSDPCLFDWVSGCGMEVCDEVRYSLGDVPCCGIGGVRVWCLCDGDFLDSVFVVYGAVVYPFTMLSDVIRCHSVLCCGWCLNKCALTFWSGYEQLVWSCWR